MDLLQRVKIKASAGTVFSSESSTEKKSSSKLIQVTGRINFLVVV